MKKVIILTCASVVVLIGLGLLIRYNFKQDTNNSQNVELEDLKYMFINENDSLGFYSGICELPVNYNNELYKVESFVNINQNYGLNEIAYYLIANNSSADIFHYICKEIEDLEPEKTYICNMIISMLTPYSSDSIGIGGSPSSSVYIKAGILKEKPIITDVDDFLILSNIDKGNQASEGEDLITLGTLGDEQKKLSDSLFQVTKEFQVTFETDNEGRAYIVVGADSGFEGLNVIGIKSIEIKF